MFSIQNRSITPISEILENIQLPLIKGWLFKFGPTDMAVILTMLSSSSTLNRSVKKLEPQSCFLFKTLK